MTPHLAVDARFAAFTVYLNEMIVRSVGVVSSPRLLANLARWLVDGENVLRVKSLDLSTERRSWIRLRVVADGTTVAESHRDGPCTNETLELRFQCPVGTGVLAEGRCVEIDDDDRAAILDVVKELHLAVQQGDSEAVVSLLSHRIPLDSRLASVSSSQVAARLKESITSLSADGLKVLPLPALTLRTVCRDSRVVVEGPDHAAPIVAVSEQSRFQMRIALAKVGDYWAVVA